MQAGCLESKLVLGLARWWPAAGVDQGGWTGLVAGLEFGFGQT